MKVLCIPLSLALLGMGGAATAQWQWLDRDGGRVFSDRAPGPEVPERNIVTRPRAAAAALQTGGSPGDPAAVSVRAEPAAPPALALPAGVDKTLQASKRQAAEADAAKRQAEKDRVAKARADNCTRAKRALADLDSGLRMALVNASGERVVLDDAARAAERSRVQQIAESECR